MKRVEGTIEGVVGSKLHHVAWIPEGQPRGSVQLLHGFAEYVERYERVAGVLVDKGFLVYGHDQAGHGKSEGVPGYVNTFDDLVEDARRLREKVLEEHPELANSHKFLLGHSMGSIVATRYVARYPDDFNGVILSGFGTRVADFEKMSGALKAFAKFIVKIAKKATMSHPLDGALMSRDPEEVEKYNNDPLMVRKPAIKLGTEWMKIQPEIAELAKSIKIPLLLIRGGGDEVMLLDKEEIDEIFKGENATVKIYDGALHECFNEIEETRNRVMEDLVNWLVEHSS